MGWAEYMRRMDVLHRLYDGPVPAADREWMKAGLLAPDAKETTKPAAEAPAAD